MDRIEFADIHIEDVCGRTLDGDAPALQIVRRSVFGILEQNALGSIATVTPEGWPHLHTAYFCYSDALDLYFLSHAGSLHSRNLAQNPAAAMTVFSSIQQWTNADRGMQLSGAGEEAKGSLVEEAERLYASRFQGYAGWKSTVKAGDPAFQYRFYRFRVTALKILDEEVFGDAAFLVASVRRV